MMVKEETEGQKTHQHSLNPAKLHHSFGLSSLFGSSLLSRGQLITSKPILKWFL